MERPIGFTSRSRALLLGMESSPSRLSNEAFPLLSTQATSSDAQGAKRSRVEYIDRDFSSQLSSSFGDDGASDDGSEGTAKDLLDFLRPGAPKFTVEDAIREAQTMTEEEKVAALADMFGNTCEISHVDKRVKRALARA
jgi:hypothetical protein